MRRERKTSRTILDETMLRISCNVLMASLLYFDVKV